MHHFRSTIKLGVWFLLAVFCALVADLSQGRPRVEAQSPIGLQAMHDRMLGLFELDGVVFTDADERTSRLIVGVQNRGLERSVEARLAVLGVPRQDVDIRVTPAITEMVALSNAVRPLVAGLEIQFVKTPFLYTCTMGPQASHASLGVGFLTNSHCTAKEGLDGTAHYQGGYGAQNLVGNEAADAVPFTGSICPKGKQCAYADVAFSKLSAGVTQSLGSVADVAGLNIVGQFSVTAEAAANASIADVLTKVGRTTGKSQGNVTASCANVAVSGTKKVLLCQDIVAAQVGPGDSGSPVFRPTGDGSAALYGILWGGYSDGSAFIYSPMANIQRVASIGSELGPLNTCAAPLAC
jgi:hypothetical protein